MGRFSYLLFVGMTALCWGVYGPVLHVGQERLGDDGQNSTLRSLICVGVAYFVIAVVVPLVVLFKHGEKGNWSARGFVWSVFAGGIGALGALGIIMAFKYGGTPVFVMPLVFGLAPVMNTLTTMLMNRTTGNASIPFYLGIFIVAIGAVGVLYFKPAKPKGHADSAKVSTKTEKADGEGNKADEKADEQEPAPDAVPEDKDVGKTTSETTESDDVAKTQSPAKAAAKTGMVKGPNIWNLMFVLMTALCWGAYGPVLHNGQSKMNGSRLRPFLCVGLAYFVIAVVVPYFLLIKFPEPGSWTHVDGVMWSLMGGTAGALGALGIIYAFNFGGKPIFIMPLVFGGAPVVNTLAETISHNLWDQLSTSFFLSLGVVILGAVTVLVSAPKGPHGKPVVAPPPAPTPTT
ncbi:MAG: hypothetical protein ABL888_11165 [Pirellulaceae bacterium]